MEIVNRVLDRLVESSDIRIRLHDKQQTLSHRALANDSHELFVSLGKKPDGPLPYPDFDHKEYYAKNAELKAKGDYEGLETYVDSLRAKHNISENVDDSFMKRRAEQIVRDNVHQQNRVDAPTDDMFDRTMSAIHKTFPRPSSQPDTGNVRSLNTPAAMDNRSEHLFTELTDHVVNSPHYPNTLKDHAVRLKLDHKNNNADEDMNYVPPHGFLARLHGHLMTSSDRHGSDYSQSDLAKRVTAHMGQVEQFHTDRELVDTMRRGHEFGTTQGRHGDFFGQ